MSNIIAFCPIERWKQQNLELHELAESLGFKVILCAGYIRIVDDDGDVDLSPELFAAISKRQQ